MKRIVVVGTSGSGKSTFSKKLSQELSIPYVALDELFWNPGWVETPAEEFRESVQQAADQPRWVIDGNYTSTQDITLPRADTAIWLNYSRAKVIYRLAKRSLWRSFSGQCITPGNRETFRRTFASGDSVLLWAWKTHPKYRRKYARLFAERAQESLKVVEFQRPREADEFLALL
ncbi:AAA family ATPase [Adhaeretor mobilis]|uniref:Topology modulation protein n=1 Tax=Adhaeretor mobilis TaxID=1930276 RepID=A0A517MQ21_9BACT|nr:AAA family ATPase [Adhaeretor mobilis]QDS96986.1 topology modulation protein [Adhaeretor mobilis]